MVEAGADSVAVVVVTAVSLLVVPEVVFSSLLLHAGKQKNTTAIKAGQIKRDNIIFLVLSVNE
jgi:hypothetical protein